MENQGPQLIVAQILVRESQQLFREEQSEEHRQEREAAAGSRPAPRNRTRLAISGALVFVAQRLAGDSECNPQTT